jgi:hypothetical protein
MEDGALARSKRVVGDENRNGLVLLANTTALGNDHNQFVWVVRCKRGHVFGLNGSDFHQRHCPECHPKYAKGLPVPAEILSDIKSNA